MAFELWRTRSGNYYVGEGTSTGDAVLHALYMAQTKNDLEVIQLVSGMYRFPNLDVRVNNPNSAVATGDILGRRQTTTLPKNRRGEGQDDVVIMRLPTQNRDMVRVETQALLLHTGSLLVLPLRQSLDFIRPHSQ